MTNPNARRTFRAQFSSALRELKNQSRHTGPAVLAGIGGFVVVYALATMGDIVGVSLLIAPFGASCVLVFGLPRSPLAQPRNVIGGHVISSAVGLACLSILGASPVSFGLGVGVAIAAMLLTRTTHPPAGADPIVVILVGASWQFLLLPALSGALIIVSVGIVFHRCVTREKYPTALAN